MPGLSVEESVSEALESDNISLQAMSGGKYVQVRRQGDGTRQYGSTKQFKAVLVDTSKI